MSKCISVLGSTGSIGRQTLQVARELGLKVAALTAGKQIDLLEQQARQFRPCLVAVFEENAARELRERLSDLHIQVMSGMEGLLAAAELADSDTVVTAVMGSVGLEPTLAAIRRKKRIALANKETLVCAGELVMAAAAECGAEIIPVDSEHSAVFQCLQGCRDRGEVRRILLTCSGGPFFDMDAADLKYVTKADALRHPNWKMGPKITVDCATLMNKGLEVIEAHHLFGMDADHIRVIVHPQSVIHSMVEFEDGAIKAQLGTADMRLPIQYALYYPERRYLAGDRLDFSKIAGIITSKPDRETFKGLDFAYRAIKTGGSMPTVLNAANECAVAKFLHKDIKFLQIYDIIEACMGEHKTIANPTLEEILETERWVYDYIERQFG